MALEAAAAAAMYQQDLFSHPPDHPIDLYSFLLLQQNYWSNPTDNIQPTFFKNNDDSSYNRYFLQTQSSDRLDLLAQDCFELTNMDNLSPMDYTSPAFCSQTPAMEDYQSWVVNSSPDEAKSDDVVAATEAVVRPRRRRARVTKNKEDIENQRMTHIAVERNRRKQMNEYLNALRSLMPESYVPRGDQASIVGGAINFVKELEQKLQCLSAEKQIKENLTNMSSSSSTSLPFQEFFTCPQYSSSCADNDDQSGSASGTGGSNSDAIAADVEVTMVETHANLKIRLKRPIKRLSKLVSGLLCLRLTVLHFNVTTADETVFYSLSLKVEDDSKLSTVDDIASSVYTLIGTIQHQHVLPN